MNTDRQSLTPAYFEALYADDADPWRFTTSDYERRKYAATLVALLVIGTAAGRRGMTFGRPPAGLGKHAS